jgi:glycosyltransferase involved in cell wall biosynthesis
VRRLLLAARVLLRAPRAWLRATFGIWVLFEARNRVLGWPRGIASRRRESAEVRRIARSTTVPAALVTTVMPTYRRPDQLRAAVASALAQEVSDHTVIVVDDGGGLPPLPEDDRLVAVSLSANTGCLGLVRNVGLRLARSPFVAFLDDDNLWRPDHLSVALDALGDGADLVYTAVERINPDGQQRDLLSTAFDRKTLADSSYVDANSIVARYDDRLRFSRLPRSKATLPKEDWEFVWRMSRTRRTTHVPVPTVRYAVNPDSYYTRWDDAGDQERPGVDRTDPAAEQAGDGG